MVALQATLVVGRPQPFLSTALRAQALAKQGSSAWLEALLSVPRHLRMMYMHAAQSFFWNAAATVRVQDHGLTLRVGDIVLPGSPWPDGVFGGDGGLPNGGMLAKPQEAARLCRRKGAGGSSAKKRIERAVTVTQADIDAARYCIEELALPLPGGGVELDDEVATGGVTGLYKRIASEAGVPMGNAEHGVTEFSMGGLTGDYRRVVTRPRGFKFHFVRHPCLDDEIVSTGMPAALLDPVSKVPAEVLPPPPPCPSPACTAAAGSADAAAPVAMAPCASAAASDASTPVVIEASSACVSSVAEAGNASVTTPLLDDAYGCVDEGSTMVMHGGGAYTALVMSFALPASSYATMLTRELLKMGTSVEEHRAASERLSQPQRGL
jgi:tRNA pseudouridine13 synthase